MLPVEFCLASSNDTTFTNKPYKFIALCEITCFKTGHNVYDVLYWWKRQAGLYLEGTWLNDIFHLDSYSRTCLGSRVSVEIYRSLFRLLFLPSFFMSSHSHHTCYTTCYICALLLYTIKYDNDTPTEPNFQWKRGRPDHTGSGKCSPLWLSENNFSSSSLSLM